MSTAGTLTGDQCCRLQPFGKAEGASAALLYLIQVLHWHTAFRPELTQRGSQLVFKHDKSGLLGHLFSQPSASHLLKAMGASVLK